VAGLGAGWGDSASGKPGERKSYPLFVEFFPIASVLFFELNLARRWPEPIDAKPV
jgi:hypothetical protein